MECTRLLNEHIVAQRSKISKQDETIRSLQNHLLAYEQFHANHPLTAMSQQIADAQCAELAAIKEEIALLREAVLDIKKVLRRHFV